VTTAIRVDNGSEIVIRDCGFEGFEVGLDVSNSQNISISGTRFSNVATAVRADRVAGLVAKGNIHRNGLTEREVFFGDGHMFRLSVAAVLVYQYLY
tara:strand:- start:404 stop:691 length:288 start_codon:yes stop_codon:yes gene_type:complete